MTTTTTGFTPVFIGVSPAGVTWVAYRPESVEPMKARLAVLKARAEPAPTPEQLAALRQLKARGTDRYGENKITTGHRGLVVRFRYAGSLREFADLVRQAGGAVLGTAKLDKTTHKHGACNNPLVLTFTVPRNGAQDYLLGLCTLAQYKARFKAPSAS